MRLLGGSLQPGDASNLFKHYSRGKRSITLDLATDEGREILYRLVADADVFLTSYLPETREKLRIDLEHIRAVNPDIVYARGSGQGPRGPEARRPGYDALTWWCRGSLAQSAMDVSGATWPTGMVGHGDGMSGMTLVSGICAALLKRAMTGETSVVDGSLMGTAVWFNGMALINSQFTEPTRVHEAATPPAMRSMLPATSTQYQTKDHRFLSIQFLGDADADFADLCEHVGRPELASDERFAHAPERVANAAVLRDIFDDVFGARTYEEWKSMLVTARGAWSPVQTPEEIFDDPQTHANGFLRHVDYPDGGLQMPIPPILFDEEGGDVPRAPDFGEHTDEILDALGFEPAEIERLRAAGVVA